MTISNDSPPTTTEVKTIAALADPVLRNLRITQCYHELAVGMAALTGPGANWCTVATWASRQAGQSIRKEDLLRALELIGCISSPICSGPIIWTQVCSIRRLRQTRWLRSRPDGYLLAGYDRAPVHEFMRGGDSKKGAAHAVPFLMVGIRFVFSRPVARPNC